MPLKNYSLLVGKATEMTLDDDASPHVEVKIEASGVAHRIAINVRSKIQPHSLLYKRFDPWQNPILAKLEQLDHGVIDVRSDRPDLALDYVQGGFLQRDQMAVAPYQVAGPQNDLREFLQGVVDEAMADDDARVFAFGETWGPDPGHDKYFGFTPKRGIHDIHLNQGSSGQFADSNAPNQDGALLVHFPGADRWVAVFLAFQSQHWPAVEGGGGGDVTVVHEPTHNLPTTVGFVAALVDAPNPEEGGETVTLLNRSDGAIDLTGWRIVDGQDRTEVLEGYAVSAGDAVRIRLRGDAVRLGNKGGKLSLVEPGGGVVHAVQYAKKDVANEGWSLLF